MRSCRVQSEGVKNESKGLQETDLPAREGVGVGGEEGTISSSSGRAHKLLWWWWL